MVRLSRFLTIGVVLASSAYAQLSYLNPLDARAGLPGGIQIAGVSAYVSETSLGNLGTGNGTSLGSMVMYGTSTDLSWFSPGPQTQVFVGYHLAYNGNARFSAMNGLDQALSFNLRRKASVKWTISLDGRVESTSVSGILFDASPALGVTRSASSFDQLSGSLSSNPGTVTAGTSALGIGMFGSRRRGASLGLTATYDKSSRLSWHWGARGTHTFPGSSNSSQLTGSIPYPSFSEGIFDFGLTYSLSRRTRIGADIDYSRTYSIYQRLQIGSASLSIEHILTRSWFLEGQAGIGALADLRVVSGPPYLKEYRGGGGVGTKRGSSTFLAAVHREIGDRYGFGAAATVGGDLSWRWQRANSPWAVDTSVGYERLAGNTVSAMNGMVYQGSISRKLNRQTSLSMQAVYASNSGTPTNGLSSLGRSGVRMSMNWTPGSARNR